MRPVRYAPWLTFALVAALLFRPATSRATEAAAGHYITGAGSQPGEGIVPPESGAYWSNVNLYYSASASGSLQLPVAGNIVTGLSAEFVSIGVTGIYVLPVKLGPFTIATGLTVAGQYADAMATLGSISRTGYSGGFGDMAISPLILGWHSGTHFLQTRVDIFAPTGPYQVGSLANVSMNYWTFTPSLSYTYLVPALGLDLSASLAIDFNTRNNATSYYSGKLLHFDSSVTKKIGTTGLSAGALFSFMEQIEDDKGALAARLGGFRGQSFSVGPLATYGFKVGRMEVGSMLRWAPEFATRNRLAGNSITLSFSGKF